MIDIVFPDECKQYIELQCNGDRSLYTEFPEHVAVDRTLKQLKPRIALDIGCGIGRASVWMAKHYGWVDTEFWLYDGHGGDEQLDGVRSSDMEYYNSLEATEAYAKTNGLTYRILDADKPLPQEEAVDLAYSYCAFGFHWPIGMALQAVGPILKPGCLCVFGVRGMEAMDWVDKQIVERPEGYGLRAISMAPTRTRQSVVVLEKME